MFRNRLHLSVLWAAGLSWPLLAAAFQVAALDFAFIARIAVAAIGKVRIGGLGPEGEGCGGEEEGEADEDRPGEDGVMSTAYGRRSARPAVARR